MDKSSNNKETDISSRVEELLEKEEELKARALAVTMKRYHEDPTARNLKDMEAAKEAMKEVQKNKPKPDAHEKLLEAKYKKAKAAYEKKDTIPNLNKYTATKKALSEYREEKAIEADPSKLIFKNFTKVLEYLQDEGWKIEKSKLHKDKGKIQKEKDGTLTKKTIDDYAAHYLEKKDGSSNDISEIAREKAQVALANEKADLKTKTLINGAMEGKLISKLEAEQKHTAQLALFTTAVDNLIYGGPLEDAIEIIGGDMRKLKSFQAAVRKQFRRPLAQYAKSLQYSIPKKSILKAMESKGMTDE